MKNSRKILLFLILVLISNIYEVDAYYNDSLSDFEVELISNMGQEFFLNHELSLNKIDNFYAFLPRARSGAVIYPEYFGGMYINDIGELVILYLSDFNKSDYFIHFTKNLESENVEFSYNEIIRANDIITNYFLFNREIESVLNISNSWTDIINNQIVVTLFNYSINSIEMFRNEIIDKPFILFEPYLGNAEELANNNDKYNTSHVSTIITMNNITLTPGDRIYFARQGAGGCSVGFRAGRSTQSGFVTAAHCGSHSVGTRVYNSAGVHIGTVRSRFLANIDASFVEVNSNVSISGVISGTTYLNPIAATAVVGQWVSARGATTTGVRGGTIAQVNANANVANIGQVTNTIIVNMFSDFGDSGGIAFSNVTGRVHNIQGIVITRIGDTQSRVSRASEIITRTGWRLE